MFLTKATTRKYYHFRNKEDNMKDEKELSVAMSAQYFTDSEPLEAYQTPTVIPPEECETPHEIRQPKGDAAETMQTPVEPLQKLREKPILLDFHDVKPKNDEKEITKDEFEHLDEKSLKLLWHYRLGRLPFTTINRMSKKGELPKKLSKCPDPMCTAYIYGQMTRRPWRYQADPARLDKQRTINQPGECVSIDQMESPIPGFIAQIKGTPTKAHYNSATVFTDHYSDVTFIHLQRSTNAQETLEAKHAFEQWATSYNVNIRHYHADNGRFAETLFMTDVARKGQTISL
jgi:hypothetical protein